MPIPDRETRDYIAFAQRYAFTREGNAAILSRLEQQFPNGDQAKMGNAVALMRSLNQSAQRLRNLQRQYEAPGRKPKGVSVCSAFDPGLDFEQLVTARVYFTGKLQNGRDVQGSLLLTFDCGATLPTVLRRAHDAIAGGHIQGPHTTYQLIGLHVEIQSITNYGRANSIPLDTAPITRTHPNPYAMGGGEE